MTQNCNNSKRVCEWCGLDISDRGGRVRWCSAGCRYKYLHNTERECKMCGEMHTNDENFKYCKSCAAKRRNKVYEPIKKERTALDEYIDYSTKNPHGLSYGMWMSKLRGRT